MKPSLYRMAFLFHFWRMKVCFNGDFYSSGEALLTSQNRSFKWGDGVFETMKVFEGRLLLEKFHFERLFISLQLLQIKTLPDFTVKNLVQNIIALCTENTCINSPPLTTKILALDESQIWLLPLSTSASSIPVSSA